MGKIKTVSDYLAEADFFEGMAQHHLRLLSGCGKIMRFKVGDFLLKEGEEANSFYLILKGEVAVESYMPAGGARMISKVGAGYVTGYSWLFPPYRNQFDSRALTKVRVIHLNGQCLRAKAEDDHDLGYQLMKKFTRIILQRMQDSRRQILDVYNREPPIATCCPE